MRNYVILAGAGASKAVNADGYPTTIEFFERLPSSITEDHYFTHIHEFVTTAEASEVVDIEMILWRLGELDEALDAMGGDRHPMGWFLKRNRLPSPTRPQDRFKPSTIVEVAQLALPGVRKVIGAINRQVYDLYAQMPHRDELESNWLPLLRAVVEDDARVEAFTTNYDVVLETALDLLSQESESPIELGWRGNVHRWLATELWADPASGRDIKPRGLLTKLHGSVNWTRDGERIYVSDPTYKGSHDRHAIVYPGFKGRPTQEPFVAFHQHLSRALLKANVLIVIGFAFRDEHINDLLDRFLNPSAAVFVIDPQRPAAMPLSAGRVAFVEQGFDEQAVEYVFKRIFST